MSAYVQPDVWHSMGSPHEQLAWEQDSGIGMWWMEPAMITLAMCAMLADDPAPAAASSPVAEPATVVVESAELGTKNSGAFLGPPKSLTFRVSAFSGCQADTQQAPALKQLSVKTLTPNKSSKSVTVPGDTNLAVFAEYMDGPVGGAISCGRALRFHSEPGKTYRIRYTLPRLSHNVPCDLQIVESQDGNEVPVISARNALLQYSGPWKGNEFNVCAEGELPPDKQPLGASPFGPEVQITWDW